MFREKPAIHRFPGNMAKRVQELCAVVDEDYGGDAGRVWGDAADTADLKQRLEALPGFGEMKVKALASVLARRYGNAMAEPLVPDHAMLGDVDSPEALAEYQAAKRAYKAQLRGRSRLIDLRFYRDGGQSAVDVANEVAEFLGAARTSLELALYDIRLHDDAAEIVTQALVGAQERGIAVRLVYNVDHPGPIPVPPPPQDRARAARGAPDRDAPDPRRPRPDAPQVRDSRPREHLDGVDELVAGFVVAAGERRRGDRLARARVRVRAQLRRALGDRAT